MPVLAYSPQTAMLLYSTVSSVRDWLVYTKVGHFCRCRPSVDIAIAEKVDVKVCGWLDRFMYHLTVKLRCT